jgi:hypothetical protein
VLSVPDGQVVATIGNGGQDACSDASGDVYFVSDNHVYEYAHGGTTPIATITLPSGGLAGGGCSVDPVTGSLAVAYAATGVAVYPNGSGSPTTYTVGAIFCGYDDKGDLFVDATRSPSGSSIYELPAGGSTFTEVSVTPGLSGSPWQVQWDGKYVTVQTFSSNPSIYRLAVTGSSATVAGTTHFKGFTGFANQSWIAGNVVYIPVGRRSIGMRTPQLGVWKYPRGGKPIALFKHINGGSRDAVIYGVALSVAPH